MTMAGGPGCRIDGAEVGTHHGADDVGLVEGRRDPCVHRGAAFAQHRHAVRNGEHLLQAMRHEDEAAARQAQPAHDVEQPVDFARRKRGRGFVEDDELGPHAERLGDLDELLLRRREPADLPVERQRVGLSEARQDLQGSHPEVAVIEAAGTTEQGKEDVLEDREVGDEARLLHHDRNTDPQRLAGVAQANRKGPVGHLARVVGVVTRDDLGQRGFTGPVCPQEAVDLALAELEIGAGQRPSPGEALCDALRKQQRRFRRRVERGGHEEPCRDRRPGLPRVRRRRRPSS